MLKFLENNRIEEIGLVTPAPGASQSEFKDRIMTSKQQRHFKTG